MIASHFGNQKRTKKWSQWKKKERPRQFTYKKCDNVQKYNQHENKMHINYSSWSGKNVKATGATSTSATNFRSRNFSIQTTQTLSDYVAHLLNLLHEQRTHNHNFARTKHRLCIQFPLHTLHMGIKLIVSERQHVRFAFASLCARISFIWITFPLISCVLSVCFIHFLRWFSHFANLLSSTKLCSSSFVVSIL